MKHCINSACNAELDDYQERCPQCGRLQKKVEITKPLQKMKSQSSKTYKFSELPRSIQVRMLIYLFLMIVGCILYFANDMLGGEKWIKSIGVGLVFVCSSSIAAIVRPFQNK